VTEPLKEILDKERPDLVVAIGPVMMMKLASEITRPQRIKTVVSLNPIMIDGTGMCGSCRVEVGGETKLACVDGPEFDGHLVNYDLLTQRLQSFREEEHEAMMLHEKEEMARCPMKKEIEMEGG